MSSGAFTKGAATQSSTDTMTVQKEVSMSQFYTNRIQLYQYTELTCQEGAATATQLKVEVSALLAQHTPTARHHPGSSPRCDTQSHGHTQNGNSEEQNAIFHTAWKHCNLVNPFSIYQLIGCVIGKNGIKIRQIRDLSQAQIRISSPGDDPSRTITISGTPDAVSTAKYLINYQ